MVPGQVLAVVRESVHRDRHVDDFEPPVPERLSGVQNPDRVERVGIAHAVDTVGSHVERPDGPVGNRPRLIRFDDGFQGRAAGTASAQLLLR